MRSVDIRTNIGEDLPADAMFYEQVTQLHFVDQLSNLFSDS